MTEKETNTKTFGETIKAKWDKLSDQDVRDIGKDMNILATKITSIYKRSNDDAQKEISEFKASQPS